jgi:hypothetical protein
MVRWWKYSMAVTQQLSRNGSAAAGEKRRSRVS